MTNASCCFSLALSPPPPPPPRLPCRRALRGVVARAQSANDERLLANPHLQLRGMLDLGRVQLDQLV